MTGLWPGDTRLVAMLTFDVDGPSGALRRDPTLADKPSLLSMGDFGPTVGLPRILDLLHRHAIPASFFVPGWIAERHPERIADIADQGHEIAHHGYQHEPAATLTSDEDEGELLDRASAILEDVTGQKPLGYRSPSWALSADSLRLLKERGFVYDSSLMGSDVPYFVEAGDGQLVEIPVHWSLDDAPYYPWSPAQGRTSTLASPKAVYEAWEWEFEGAYSDGGALILTLHPYFSGHHGRLQVLERLINHMKARGGVEFMRCIDVANGWSDAGLAE